MLGQRDDGGGCDAGTKGVVTGDETTPASLADRVIGLAPLLAFSDRPGILPPSSPPTISPNPGDRDVVRSDRVAATEANDRRNRRDSDLIDVRANDSDVLRASANLCRY